jgi:hypothetical protein
MNVTTQNEPQASRGEKNNSGSFTDYQSILEYRSF